MTDPPRETDAPILAMMASACKELHDVRDKLEGVREKLEGVSVLSARFETLEKQLGNITNRLDSAARLEIELAEIKIKLSGYEDIKKKVDGMTTKIAVACGVVAIIVIAFQAGPAWLERFDKNDRIHPKAYSSGDTLER